MKRRRDEIGDNGDQLSTEAAKRDRNLQNVRCLLNKQGAHTHNFTEADELTKLDMVCGDSNAELEQIKSLIRLGRDLDVRDYHGDTMLHRLCRKRQHYEMNTIDGNDKERVIAYYSQVADCTWCRH